MLAFRHSQIFNSLLICLLCFVFSNIHANARIDSLKLIAKNAKSNDISRIQNDIAFSYYENGDMKNSLVWGQKSLASAKESNNLSDEAKALKTIGLCERFNGNNDKALEIFKTAADIHFKLGDKKNYASCLSQQANCYSRMSKISTAIEYFQKAIKINEEIKNDNPALLSNAGLAYFEIGLYDKAYNLFIKALLIDEKAKDEFGIGADYANIANIYIKQEKFDIALDYYKKAYQIFLKMDFKEQIALLSANLGATYFDMKIYDKALEYYTESLKTRREINNPLMIANVLNSIGTLHIKREDYTNAREYLNEALIMAEKSQSVKAVSLTQLNIGTLEKYQKNYSEALLNLEKSSITAAAEKIYDILPNVYLNMSEVWAFKNDYKKSLEYYKQYTAVKDTIANKNRERNLFELQTRFETAKKEQEIIVLKNENKLIHEKNVMKNIVIVVSLVVIIVLLLLAYLAYRLYNEKKLANDILLEEFKMVNEKLQTQNQTISTKSEVQQAQPQKLKFNNANGTEEVVVNSDDLLYINALENYLEIIWLEEGKRQKSIIRNTMKNIEQMLNENNSLVRSHRSYIVNLMHVNQVIGKSQNYKIELRNSNDEIPISRNYSKDILAKINASFTA
jgi:two-component system sensor histidine kinase/response regulator